MPTLTAAGRRERERRDYDAYLAECPSHNLLAQISGKWITLLVSALAEGTRRYSDLSRAIPSVSQKMLTQSLRTMERDGLITRTVTAAVPVRVEYELTALGKSLVVLLTQVKDWAESNMDDVYRARLEYDAREESEPVAALNRRP
ncbi:helix-turn-helix domain-containing protein [Phytomonospora sp. NPDC050363]|uniref:winged helix-turn-helix transcriptional regulator n=1 Tax=Phytomonospora sp. NPDC050363 TaxID=3155642 RepID=UPI0033D71A02